MLRQIISRIQPADNYFFSDELDKIYIEQIIILVFA